MTIIILTTIGIIMTHIIMAITFIILTTGTIQITIIIMDGHTVGTMAGIIGTMAIQHHTGTIMAGMDIMDITTIGMVITMDTGMVITMDTGMDIMEITIGEITTTATHTMVQETI